MNLFEINWSTLRVSYDIFFLLFCHFYNFIICIKFVKLKLAVLTIKMCTNVSIKCLISLHVIFVTENLCRYFSTLLSCFFLFTILKIVIPIAKLLVNSKDKFKNILDTRHDNLEVYIPVSRIIHNLNSLYTFMVILT